VDGVRWGAIGGKSTSSRYHHQTIILETYGEVGDKLVNALHEQQLTGQVIDFYAVPVLAAQLLREFLHISVQPAEIH